MEGQLLNIVKEQGIVKMIKEEKRRQEIEDLLQKVSKGKEYNSLTKNDWKNISCNKKLTEDFIREFQNEVDWDRISLFNEILSDEFKNEFENEINLDVMVYDLWKEEEEGIVFSKKRRERKR